ncbi:diacylglycerol/lipid kinase family protein [Hazenella coriacea]|uniref:YegS/Rv2252/BmrU family lipid kinase n=1 Tax=Hazenella coriacea TaxID=1179467 RepID=A0A4R3L548_9BACL|nr:diacylglycerol kinase family protein [Hazenella coriacea]TCS91984.1 YegS/Rv2252/BmrU family lipid kinase [Hazenella coriacea]
MYLFIVNPISGNGRGKGIWGEIQKALDEKEIPYQVRVTEYQGHAVLITQEAVEQGGFRAVIAVGGDGTVHEVGNCLAGTQLPLGYIPAGTGNDFATAEKIPSQPLQALERILKHEARAIDTAKVNGKVIIGFIGIGFDAQVTQHVNGSSLKKWLGKFSYLVGVFRTFFRFRPARFTLQIDEEAFTYDDVWLAAISNIPNYGGGMMINPGAINDDGILQVCCVYQISRFELLRMFPTVYWGTHTSHPSVALHQGAKVRIQADPPLPVQIDGEIYGETPMTIEIQPKSLLIL